jgi:hypothetical protein
MTITGYLIWIVAMAFMIIAVLTIGTLAAAGMLEGRPKADAGRPAGDTEHDDADQPSRELVDARGEGRRAA